MVVHCYQKEKHNDKKVLYRIGVTKYFTIKIIDTYSGRNK